MKFSSMPCTGRPLTRKEMHGVLRSRQQLTTSSFFNRWGKTELTLRPTQPERRHNLHNQTGSEFSILIFNLITLTSAEKKLNQKPWFAFFFLTWPEVKAIKAKGTQVITHPIATPGVAPCGPGQVALAASPAHAQVGGLRCEERLHVIHSQLIVPSPGLGWILARSQEYVWSHAAVKYWTDGAKAEKVKLASAFLVTPMKINAVKKMISSLSSDCSWSFPHLSSHILSGSVWHWSYEYITKLSQKYMDSNQERNKSRHFKLMIFILRQNYQH